MVYTFECTTYRLYSVTLSLSFTRKLRSLFRKIVFVLLQERGQDVLLCSMA